MRYVVLSLSLLATACSTTHGVVEKSTETIQPPHEWPLGLVVIDSIEKAEKLNDPSLYDCPPDVEPPSDDNLLPEICISLNCGYAEYTYLANTVPAYLADEEKEKLKPLVVIGPTGHYCDLYKSQINYRALAKLGRLKGRLFVESSAMIQSYLYRINPFNEREYIVDFRFIEENNLSAFLQELPASAEACISKEESDCGGWGEMDWDEIMNAPGSYINSDGEACYGQALFLDQLPVSSPSNQSNKAPASQAGTH